MEQDSQADAVHAAITTAEHRSLGNVLAVIRRLEELRSRGLSSAQIAERIRLTHPNRPGGGPWSPEAVDRVLEIADANRRQASPPSAGHPMTQPLPATPPAPGPPTPPAPTRPAPPDHRSIDPDHYDRQTTHAYPPPIHHSLPEVDRSIPQQPLPEPSTDRPQYRSPIGHQAVGGARRDDQRGPLRVEPRRYHQRPAARPEETIDPDAGRRRAAVAGIVTLIGLVAAGVGLYQVGVFDRFTITDEQATPAAPATTSSMTADGRPTSDEVSGEEVTAPASDGDAADSLVIRIEPSTPETDDGIAPASATIRTDGKLYVEGAFRSEPEAQRFLEAAAGVFGEGALVPRYTIDAAAPDPTVSDVVLEKPVLFESGSAVIDPEYIPFLEACGNVLKENSHIVMSVSAFTDAAGSAEFNLQLSQQRADAVIDFYRSLDIGDNQLISTGFGESDFVADNDTEEGRQRNRRAMLELLNVMTEG